MNNRFEVDGNIGDAPEFKKVPVKNEDRSVIKFRMFHGRYRRNEITKEYEQIGGFWITVQLWGGMADEALRVLRKGMSVHVVGDLIENVWENEKKEKVFDWLLNAESFYLKSSRIESITMKPKREKLEPESSSDSSAADIPF